MARYKILVSDGLAETGLALLQGAGEVVNQPMITAAELLKVLPGYQALVVRSRTKVTAEVIEAGQLLKVIGRAGVGVDNIDVRAAVAHGITVVNSPQAATNAVAEHTFALMLALARNMTAADTSMKGQKWEKSTFMGSELSGKTLGLLGLGRIGARVAHLAAAFGMTILAYDPLVETQAIRERGAEPATFEDILARSDYISLHLPLTPATRNLIGPAQFDQMKHGARLVCTARGGVVDENALGRALDSNHLAGAALDVFASEPPSVQSIAEHPKVIATPHISAQTKEAQLKAGVAIAEEVIAVLSGKEPRWRITNEQ